MDIIWLQLKEDSVTNQLIFWKNFSKIMKNEEIEREMLDFRLPFKLKID